MSFAPLLDLFIELRTRHDLPLGVADYLAAQRALAAGFGGTRADLLSVCQTLWAKSREGQTVLAAAFDDVMPRPLQEDELSTLTQPPEAETSLPGDTETPAPVTPPVAETPETPPAVLDLQPVTPGAGSLTRPATRTRAAHPFDLVGELPVPLRTLKRSWRYVRRMQRTGPAVELDVEATADRYARDGFLLAPVLVPARRNLAAVLVLADEGGSMTPFRRQTRALIEAFQQAGFSRATVAYFHDVIADDVVYLDPARLRPCPLSETLAPFTQGAILILSDAGAARGHRDRTRIRRTQTLLRTLRATTPRLAWLNPMPRDRWRHTTAHRIHCDNDVPMFPYDREGLELAMEVLRGK